MTARLRIRRAGALTTLQDTGRPGYLGAGVAASGPMDRSGFALAAAMLGGAGLTGIECTTGGLELSVEAGGCNVGFAGGAFSARRNGDPLEWPGTVVLASGDTLTVTPGDSGNFAYLRFDGLVAVPPILGSAATNSRIGLGGGVLNNGDLVEIEDIGETDPGRLPPPTEQGPIRMVWGLHAEHFTPETRAAMLENDFRITSQMDRMGMRLDDQAGVFATPPDLTLISDAIVAGDIQILGDGTPIVLMRDHQPTGGYPRIATVITVDLDRLAQLRPGSMVRFRSVTVQHAQALLRQGV